MAQNNAPDFPANASVLVIDVPPDLENYDYSWLPPSVSFFPSNWRDMPKRLYIFCCMRAYNFCSAGHPLVEIFRPSLISLVKIQREIQRSGSNLPATTLGHLEQVELLLRGQLAVMQRSIIQELEASEAELESENESESESASETESESGIES